jgi:hypothetical protein
VLLAWAAAAPAAETYTIKVKQFAEPGKSVTIKDALTSSNSLKSVDADGKVVEEKKFDTTVHEQVYTEKVLERGDKRPKKFKQTYEKAVIVNKDRDKVTELSFQGRTIIYTLKDDKYEVSVEGDKPVSKSDLASLKRQANCPDMDSILLPKQAVKVKGPWKLDVAKVAKSFGVVSGYDLEKSKAEAQLVKAYKKNGKQYGVIELNLLLVSKPDAKKPNASGTTDFKVTLDTSIDGSESARTLTITFKMKGTENVDRNGKKLTQEMSFDMSYKMERSSEK